jgi:hypothetical protein
MRFFLGCSFIICQIKDCCNRTKLISRMTVSDAISDYETSKIFKTIASTQPNTNILITNLKLRKQYYTRISCLITAGLVKRKRVDFWKLRAIDSVDIPSREQHDSIITTMIDNQEIKSILLNL